MGKTKLTLGQFALVIAISLFVGWAIAELGSLKMNSPEPIVIKLSEVK